MSRLSKGRANHARLRTAPRISRGCWIARAAPDALPRRRSAPPWASLRAGTLQTNIPFNRRRATANCPCGCGRRRADIAHGDAVGLNLTAVAASIRGTAGVRDGRHSLSVGVPASVPKQENRDQPGFDVTILSLTGARHPVLLDSPCSYDPPGARPFLGSRGPASTAGRVSVRHEVRGWGAGPIADGCAADQRQTASTPTGAPAPEFRHRRARIRRAPVGVCRPRSRFHASNPGTAW